MARVVCPVKEAVEISGKEAAIIQGDSIVLYSQLDVFVSATAGKLLTHGISEGQSVALRLQHRIRSIVLILACIRIKAIACPLSSRIPNQSVGTYLSRLGATFWVDDFPCEEQDIPTGIRRVQSGDVTGQLMEDLDLELSSFIELGLPATTIFTTGSSSQPKPALLTYGSHYYSALGANPALNLKSHCKWLLNLPLYHVSGLGVIFRCIKAGACLVLPQGQERISDLIQRERVTHLSAVPTQLHRYLQDESMVKSMKSLQALLVGGARVSRELVQQTLHAEVPLYTCYGLTETGSLVTLATPDQLSGCPGTSGSILRFRELRLDGHGEIWIRGATLFAGYQGGDALECPFDDDGWFATGDIAELDGQGLLYFKGRRDWVFTSGGENIHPEEIETAILQLPGFVRSVVVPVEDREFGHRPLAVVDRKNVTMTDDQIRVALGEFLPRFKIPDRFVDWPEDLLVDEGIKLNRSKITAWVRNLG